jgi:hypothetical protein
MFAYLDCINVIDKGSIMKRRYQRLKAIRKSKLPKIVMEILMKVDTED